LYPEILFCRVFGIFADKIKKKELTMKKLLLLIGLMGLSLGARGQKQEYGCGPSRKYPERKMMNMTVQYAQDKFPFTHTMTAGKVELSIAGGEYLRNFRMISVDHAPPYSQVFLLWEQEMITQFINEERDFHYEIVFRNPGSKRLAQFKSELKSILECRYGGISMISEGADFMEYEAEGKRFYHGFFLAPKLINAEKRSTDIASFEFIGVSSLANYAERKGVYVNIFEENRTILTNFTKGLKIKPIK
jgi:hypothetical protein